LLQQTEREEAIRTQNQNTRGVLSFKLGVAVVVLSRPTRTNLT
jgi:hypothetical protein